MSGSSGGGGTVSSMCGKWVIANPSMAAINAHCNFCGNTTMVEETLVWLKAESGEVAIPFPQPGTNIRPKDVIARSCAACRRGLGLEW